MWNKPTKERLNRIPRLYETESIDLKDKTIHLHFFIGASDWYIAEYDGDDLFFGYAILNDDIQNAEWGYISFTELREINISGIENGTRAWWHENGDPWGTAQYTNGILHGKKLGWDYGKRKIIDRVYDKGVLIEDRMEANKVLDATSQ